ncbi:MAG: MCE family protein [Phycisphaerae bacterium]|nr:MCE family protein [Phycisphaerae bacterium]
MPFDRTEPVNVRAGVGVFLAIAAAGLLLWLALSFNAHARTNYTVHFTPVQGVYGIKPGSHVRVGGLVKGQVTAVYPLIVDAQVRGYRADFVLENSVPLFRAARIQATGGTLSGDSVLEIVDVGRGPVLAGPQPIAAREVRPAQAGDVFDAVDPADFDELVGPLRSHRVRGLIQAFQDLKGPVSDIASDGPERLEAFRSEWTALVTAIRDDVDGWRAQWHTLANRAEAAVKKLGATTVAEADSGAAQAGTPDANTAEAVVPGLRALRNDLESIDLSADTRRAKMVGNSVTGAVETLDSIQAQVFAFRNALEDAYTGLGLAAADFAIAGQQLSATKSEVVSSPWRLFGQPSDSQARAADRVDQARLFTQAATEYETAIQSIRQTLADDGAMLARTPGLADLLANRIGAASAAFDAALERFANELLGEATERSATPTTPAAPARPADSSTR